jgi:enoyl-CoA hydratase/carnithine racemase
MQSSQPAYFSQYRSLKLTRYAQGVLVAEFHSNGVPLICTAQDHKEFVDAFNRISQDRANQIVILTGTGGALIPAFDFAFFVNVAHPDVWNQVHDDGVQIRIV